MDLYLPSDNRAEYTLNLILDPFIKDLYNSNSIKDITTSIVTYLPPGIAHEVELRFRMKRDTKDVDLFKIHVDNVVRHIILSRVCIELPYIIIDDDRVCYYMREDILAWIDKYHYFNYPPEEIITVSIQDNRSELTLNKDQIIGMAYAINAANTLGLPKITLHSSVTKSDVSIHDIVEHALVYRLPITLATEQYKRPYRVDILQSDNNFLTINFKEPYFVQGLISVCHWLQIPNRGKNVIWKNLFQFTREGLIPLTF